MLTNLSIYSADRIRARTAEARAEEVVRTEREQPVAQPETAQQRRLRTIAETIRDNEYGCAKDAVRSLVEAIVGQLPELAPAPEVERRTFVVGSVVLLRRKPYLVRSLDSDHDALVVDANGEQETTVGDGYILRSEPWKPATEAQVERFLFTAGLI